MKLLFLRNALLGTAALVFIGQGFGLTLPYVNGNASLISAGDDLSLFSLFMQDLSYFFIAMPIVILCLWAAHNLRPLTYLSSGNLVYLIWFTQCFVVLGLVFEFIKTIQAIAPYFPEISLPTLSAIVDTFNWFIYSAAELAMLSFAAIQTKAKQEKRTLDVAENEEVLS